MCGEFIVNHHYLNSSNVLLRAISINKICCKNSGCVILPKIIFSGLFIIMIIKMVIIIIIIIIIKEIII